MHHVKQELSLVCVLNLLMITILNCSNFSKTIYDHPWVNDELFCLGFAPHVKTKWKITRRLVVAVVRQYSYNVEHVWFDDTLLVSYDWFVGGGSGLSLDTYTDGADMGDDLGDMLSHQSEINRLNSELERVRAECIHWKREAKRASTPQIQVCVSLVSHSSLPAL